MRRLLLVLLIGCASPTHAPQSPASPATSTATVERARAGSTATKAAAAPGRRFAPVTRDVVTAPDGDVILREGRGMYFTARTDVAESDFWSTCVRDFVTAQPEALRRQIGAALAQYVTTCDTAGRVVLDRPLGSDARDRRSRSDIVFVGTLAPKRVAVALRVAYCGGEPTAIDRITLVTKHASWTSPRLEFARDANGCESAELPYARPIARVLREMIDADDGIVRFEGRGLVGELTLGESVSQELALVLDAMDAINGP